MSLFKLFTRDTQFFDLLERGAEEARNGATTLRKLLEALGQGSTETLSADLAQSRRKHKKIANETSESITRVFVTPIEREDIEGLSNALYRISKTVEKVGERLTICPPGARLDTVKSEVANIEHACNLVVELVSRLRKGATLAKVRDARERLESVEGDADKGLLQHLRELYHSEQDARLLIYWKELYDLLEKATDRCRDVGNVVLHIVLKNS
jgi:uncharacterized protein Yka (UPF0111/DUF47 family)